MTDAYLHLVAQPGELTGVASDVAEINNVSAIHVVTGEFDLIARLDFGGLSVDTIDILHDELGTEPREELPQTVIDQVESLDRVESVSLNLAFEP